MLEIWGRRNSSNVMPVMWLVAELNLPHVHHRVGGSFGGLDTPEYLGMNPNGLVPTIKDGESVLFESNTILRYLARKYGPQLLGGETEHQRAVAEQWVDWCKATLYQPLIGLFFATVRTEPEFRNVVDIEQWTAKLIPILKIAEARLNEVEYFAGSVFSIADLPNGALLHRYFNLPIERPSLPSIERWYTVLQAREAFRQHVMLPVGNTPEQWLENEQRYA